MNDVEILKDARDQLGMILSFFPRVDAKLSTVLAVDVAMLAFLSAGLPSLEKLSAWSIVPAVIAVILLTTSFFFLYKGAFPNLKGGHSSVVYFKDIAARNEAKFVEDYTRNTPESLRADVLSQIWRNSEILSSKFFSLRIAFIAMASAILPWAISVAIFAIQRADLKVTVSH